MMEDADTFLQKPFSTIVLISQVRQILKRAITLLPERPEDVLPLNEVKRIYIRHVVEMLGHNVKRAAEALQIHRQTATSALEENGE